VREGGGVCIADEVQVGFGRVGTHFWGFETQVSLFEVLNLFIYLFIYSFIYSFIYLFIYLFIY